MALLASAIVSVPGPSAASAETATRSGTDWPQHYHGPHHRSVNYAETALSPSTVGNLELAWSTGKRLEQLATGDPVVANGMVYAVIDSIHGKDSLEAFDETTGALRWKRNGDFSGTPAIVGDRLVVSSYFPSSQIAAFTARGGHPLWSTSMPGIIDFTATNDTVYTATTTFADRVDAVDLRTGAVKWRFASNQNSESSAPVVDGSTIYFGESSGEDGELRALDAATGATVWSNPHVIPGGPLSIANGRLYLGTWDDTTKAFDAATGLRLWSRRANDIVFTAPAVDDGVVYSGSLDRNLYALDARTGRLEWHAGTGGQVRGSAAVANGVVYFGSDDGTVDAVDAGSGASLWKATIGGDVGSPAVAGGMVFVTRNSLGSGPAIAAYRLP
jgi:outer membrane protein assembly factor BamB